MKISKLIIALLFATSIFAITPAKADDNQGTNQQQNDDRGEDDSGNDRSNLPINSQAWFLIIAGVGISFKVLIGKAKEVKIQNSSL